MTQEVAGSTAAPLRKSSILLNVAVWTLDALWFFLFASWLTGRIAGDRTIVLQWVSWIPTLGVVATGLIWLACRAGFRRRDRRRRWGGLACVAITIGAAVRNEWRPWSSAPPASPQDLRIVQWNTDYPSGNDSLSEAALANLEADIFLISNRGSITAQERARTWAGPDYSVAGAGLFACVTRFPVEEARTVAVGGQGRDLVWIAKFTLRPPSWGARPLRIAMIDLPSKPSLPRAEVTRELIADIQRGGLGEVDLVAGDFNALPGSSTVLKVFPNFHDSWEEAGSGIRNSWPRKFPLWSIDHVLLSPELQAVQSTTRDPGTSKHRMNVLILRPR
ncbi:MAG: hypothetical protein K8R92_11640 [Planctomycetes bacterium]|nr:hypothetical protein [Planctomycetota bacterium]